MGFNQCGLITYSKSTLYQLLNSNCHVFSDLTLIPVFLLIRIFFIGDNPL